MSNANANAGGNPAGNLNSTSVMDLFDRPDGGDAAVAGAGGGGGDARQQAAPSYADLVNRMNESIAMPARGAVGPPPALSPRGGGMPPPLPVVPMTYPEVPTVPSGGGGYFDDGLDHLDHLDHPEAYYQPRPLLARASRKPSDGGQKKRKLAFLRPALIVGLIVFFVLRSGAPQIARLIPASIDAATGKFTVAGLLMVSALSGGAYLGITELTVKLMDFFVSS